MGEYGGECVEYCSHERQHLATWMSEVQWKSSIAGYCMCIKVYIQVKMVYRRSSDSTVSNSMVLVLYGLSLRNLQIFNVPT